MLDLSSQPKAEDFAKYAKWAARTMKAALFEAQCQDWLYTARAMSGDHTCGSGHGSQLKNCGNGDPWIAALNPIELGGNVPAERHGAGHANSQPDYQQKQSFLHHQPDDGSGLCAERHSHT